MMFYLDGQPAGGVYRPKNLSLYAYSINNPVNYKDPNGEWVLQVLGVLVTAYDAYENYQEGGWSAVGEGLAADALTNIATGGLGKLGTKAIKIAGDTTLGKQALSYGKEAVDNAASKVKAQVDRLKGAGKGCSFSPETLILTKDGYKEIVDVKVGDYVKSKSDETGEVSWRRVTNTFKDWHEETITFTVIDENGVEEKIVTTKEHPFYIEGKGWLTAGDIESGAIIAGPESPDKISIVNKIINETPWYAHNFTVDVDHTYFVGQTNMWVHNACPVKASTMQQKVQKDQAPAGIKRFDKAEKDVPNSKDHVHKTDGTSMNNDGTVHDKNNGIPVFTNKEKKFLEKNNWPTEAKVE